MSKIALARPKVSGLSLVDEFILYASDEERNKLFQPCVNAENQAAQAMLFEAVNGIARHSGASLNEAYHKVMGYIAVQKQMSKEALLNETPPVMRSAMRKVGHQCGEPVPGWGSGK